MREVWLPVPGYPRYMVSTYGDIYSGIVDRNLKQRMGTNGFYKVEMHGIEHYVHRVVAMTFFEDYKPSLRVRHKNEDRSNNRFDNLELLRPKAKEDFNPTGRPKAGVRVQIVETGDVFRSVRDVANHIGGSYSAVYACLRGDRDSHLGLHFEWY